jgi:hypothetical protein
MVTMFGRLILLEEGPYDSIRDNWNIQESLVPGSPCTVTTDQFTNRTLNLDSDITLDPVAG